MTPVLPAASVDGLATDPAGPPQPIGIFPLPAGLLLVAHDETAEPVRASLVAGRGPRTWPEHLTGLERAYGGDREGALAALMEGSGGEFAAYNRWVLDPDSDDPASIRAGLPPALAPLVDIVSAMLDRAPAPDPRSLPAETTGEVLALAWATWASTQLESGDLAAARAALTSGAQAAGARSPVLAASLAGDAASLARHLGDPDAEAALVAAADALADTDLVKPRAELLLLAGSVSQEAAASGRYPDAEGKALLHRGMQHYYAALQLVSETSDPYLWASLNLNLAAAQLAVPMTSASDQLRLGVASQALRACRRVFTPAQHPHEWSTATLNLANALVYTPSTHQADNLVEAVSLYAEVLDSGIRDADPAGRARVLANQGNALAHLGVFDDARSALVEARSLFEEVLDHDGVATVRGVLDEIAKTQVSDPDAELADLARQASQMARMPVGEGSFRSGMGVNVIADLESKAPPKPVITVVDKKSRPTGPA